MQMGSGPRVEAALSEHVVARLLSWRGRHEKDEIDKAKEMYQDVKGKVKTASGEVAAGLKKAEQAISKPLHSIIETSVHRPGSTHGGSVHTDANAHANANASGAVSEVEIAKEDDGDLDLEQVADKEAALENGAAAYHYPYGDV